MKAKPASQSSPPFKCKCVWCGATAEAVSDVTRADGSCGWAICCQGEKCGACGPVRKTHSGAVLAYNKGTKELAEIVGQILKGIGRL